MTAVYDREELTFQYPENWKFEEDPKNGIPRTISVTSKAGAYWSATICDSARSTKELKQEYLETFKQEYEDLEMHAVEFEIGKQTMEGLDLQFYCLDFLVHSRLIIQLIGQHRVLIAWQAEDRDFDKLEPIFAAITFSAVQSRAPK